MIFKMNCQKCLKDRTYVVSTLWLGLYMLLLALQGFDISDEGWVMTSYQQIFNCPSSIEYYFLYYLTAVVGGVWEMLFGWGGYLSYRILSIIVTLCTYTLIYNLLKTICKKRYWIGIGFFILLSLSHFVMSFNHNQLTTLMAVSIATFLVKSEEGNGEGIPYKTNIKYLFAASLLTGCCVFVRLPNLTLLGVLAVVLLLSYFYHRNLKELVRNAGIVLSGFLCGLLIIIILMRMLGHLDIFTSSLSNNLLSAASSSSSNHSIAKMLPVYINNYIQVLKILLALGIPVLAGWIFSCKWSLFRKPFSVFCVLWVASITYRYGRDYGIYLIYALSFCISAISLYVYRKDRRIVALICISVSIAVLLPLGSDFGLGNMGSSAIKLCFPLAVVLFIKLLDTLDTKGCETQILKLSGISFLIVFEAVSMYKTYYNCYGDRGARMERRYLIKESPLATTFTTKETAAEMDSVLVNLRPYIKEGDYTLFFHYLPTLHYLTKTKPYLYNAWVWTYDADNLERQFARAESEIAALPVVVREKCALPCIGDIKEFEWWDSTEHEDSYLYVSKRIALIKDFISRHHYHEVWEDDYFVIYVPF